VAGNAESDAFRNLLERSWNRPTARDWAEVIAGLPLFAGVGKRHLRKIASLAEVKEFEPGDFVVVKDEPADAFYLILGGRAKVLGRSRSRTLGIGDYFGEMALLDGGPRSATVTAVDELQTMRLRRRPFLKLLESEPKIAIAMLAELSGRIRRVERPAAV
jgi:CRP/FNR family transcriptional regulator, cyclic AMP receptor protein